MSDTKRRGKKFDDHEEEDSHHHDEPWLVSYADMMTLLFGFFVLMYSFASKNTSSEWQKVKREMAKQFGSQYVSPYEKMVKDIREKLKNTALEKDFEIKETDDGLEITFRSTLLFESGHGNLVDGAMNPLRSLVQVFSGQSSGLKITVEGHTDDNAIATEKFPSNWELSGARASAVARLFEEARFPMQQLEAKAFSSTRPLLPNRDANGNPISDNQSRNRRVVLRVASLMQDREGEKGSGEEGQIPMAPPSNGQRVPTSAAPPVSAQPMAAPVAAVAPAAHVAPATPPAAAPPAAAMPAPAAR